MHGQYLGKHFFKGVVHSMDRAIVEAVVAVLKSARRVAWHIDVGGGVLCIMFYYLNAFSAWDSLLPRAHCWFTYSGGAVQGFHGSVDDQDGAF